MAFTCCFFAWDHHYFNRYLRLISLEKNYHPSFQHLSIDRSDLKRGNFLLLSTNSMGVF